MKEQQAGITASSIVISAADRSRFLEGLTMSDRATVLAAATPRHMHANSVAVRQGDPADFLFLIVKGRARHFYITPEGKKIVLLWLTEGQIFGGSALLSASIEYLVGTEVLSDSYVLTWPRRTIRALTYVRRTFIFPCGIATPCCQPLVTPSRATSGAWARGSGHPYVSSYLSP